MKRGYERRDRVADLIQKTLAQMLLVDSNDDRFHRVTVTGVTLSRDLSYAKVYVSVLYDEPEKIAATVQALNQNAKTFRYELAHAVKLRIAPEIKFVYDESTARGFKISSLIDAATKNDNQEDNDK